MKQPWCPEQRDFTGSKFCCMEPTTMAAIGIGGSLAGGGLSFLGANSQSKRIRQAMQDYLNYINNARNTFLNQEETGAIRNRLKSFIGGNVGYGDDVLKNMRAGVIEDYGKSLADMTRLTSSAGAGRTGVYTPGRADRTARLLGQNIAAMRANNMRDIATKNADVALNNERFAVSALPTYMPGLPSTPTIGPDVFMNKAAGADFPSFLGQAITGATQPFLMGAAYGPIMQAMMSRGYGLPPGAVPEGWEPITSWSVPPTSRWSGGDFIVNTPGYPTR